MTKRRRHTPEQIIRKLAEGSKLLAGGAELDEVCRHLQVAESTWHRWLAQCGGLHVFSAQVGHAPVDRQVRDRVAS